ncbi:MAG TPA: phosphatase PAP2 family protein, partial [Polyangiaceae bacterium]|nr:phosphatase PAP2 family protein [Polyangiaceae bacterium]
MGTQDWMVLAYHTILVLGVLIAPRVTNWERALFDMSWIWLFLVTALVLVRGRLIGQRAEAILYRIVMLSTVEASYFCFRRVLPVINPGSLDPELQSLDLRLFGLEPALAVQPWVSGPLTEWFSFFYFGYFFVICAHIVPIVLFSRDRSAQHEFTFGVLLTFCVGHLIYTLVPGFGPGAAMASSFHTALPRGPWFDTVWNTVQTGGALKDIFPSIHTAVPTFITLWSFRHRTKLPYRYTWPCVAFVAANVVLATMYLRWHYLIDVVAGFTLGTLAFLTC